MNLHARKEKQDASDFRRRLIHVRIEEYAYANRRL